jgi:hypothetical protein
MNCPNWEERLALHVGGDLAEPEAAAADRHLADCAGCQVFFGGLKAGLAALQASHAEELASAHFAAVRRRVLAEIAGQRRPFWRRAWMYAAVAVVAALWLLAVRPAAVPPPPEVALFHPPAPPPVVTDLPRVRPASSPVRRAAQKLVIRVVTDNPEVVIYWISERRGD